VSLSGYRRRRQSSISGEPRVKRKIIRRQGLLPLGFHAFAHASSIDLFQTKALFGRVVRHRRPYTDEWLRASVYPSLPVLSRSHAAPPTLAFGSTVHKTSSLNPRRARSPRHFNLRTPSLPPEVDEVNLFNSHKVSTRNPITLLQVVSFAFLAVVLVSVMALPTCSPPCIRLTAGI
jgi:hypothetical protein